MSEREGEARRRGEGEEMGIRMGLENLNPKALPSAISGDSANRVEEGERDS